MRKIIFNVNKVNTELSSIDDEVIVFGDDGESHYFKGKLHREDGPAVITDHYIIWKKNGLTHRNEEEPAIERLEFFQYDNMNQIPSHIEDHIKKMNRKEFISNQALTYLNTLEFISYPEKTIEELCGYILELTSENKETMEEKKRIPVNIWDDFYEDGYVPVGKIQETYAYVEDYDFNLADSIKYLSCLMNWIKENITYLDGVKMWMSFYDSKIKYPNTEAGFPHFCRQEIRFQYMTHKQLDRLVDDLNKANLTIDGLPFDIYSES